MITIAIFEALSIGSIFPLLNNIFSIDFDNSNYLNYFTNYLKIIFKETFIYGLLAIIFAIFFLKNIFIFFYTKFASAFMMHLSLDIQRKTFQKYLYENYEKLRYIDSNEILRDINIESRLVVAQFISPILTLYLNCSVIAFITILLLIYNYKVTLFIILFLFLLFILFKFVFNNKLFKLGQDRQSYQKDILKSIKQTFDGFRELSTYNFLELFLKNFVKKSIKLANNAMRRSIIIIIPKLVLETLVIASIVTAIAIMFSKGYEMNSIFLTISIYTISGLRIFPIFVAIINAYQTLNYSLPALNRVYDLLGNQKFNKNEDHRSLKFDDKISLENIYYDYNNKNILNNFSLTIPKNFFLGVTGPSGCGKSTLVDIISGIIKPKSGNISVDGINIKEHAKSWSKKIAYVQQKTYLFDSSIIKNITFQENEDDVNIDRLNYSLELSGLKEFVDGLKNKLYSNVGEFGKNISGGQHQRIGLARAIYKNPEVIIIDEGLSNLNDELKEPIIKRLIDLKREKIIIYVSHNLSDLSKCDKVIKL